MKINHHMRRENSGLVHTTLELVEEEQRQGHAVRVVEPSNGVTPMLSEFEGDPDIHCIHSQLAAHTYHDGIPKVMWMHGEPLGSVGNQISMRAIVDLAPTCEAFLCMRREEWPVWQSIKKTHLVPKGIDLNRFIVQDPAPEKLAGDPAILYYENWRGNRNPILLCVAMLEVLKEFPDAKLHLYNCPGGKMHDTFQDLIKHNRWYTFIHSLMPQERDVVTLLNRADVVVSCLYPLYARGIEALGCGRPFIAPGYREHDDWPFPCELEPHSIAQAIIQCVKEDRGADWYRGWAQKRHDIAETIRQSVDIYRGYA